MEIPSLVLRESWKSHANLFYRTCNVTVTCHCRQSKLCIKFQDFIPYLSELNTIKDI